MVAPAHTCWQKYVAPTSYFDYIVYRRVVMQKAQRIPESIYWALRYGGIPSRNPARRAGDLTKVRRTALALLLDLVHPFRLRS